MTETEKEIEILKISHEAELAELAAFRLKVLSLEQALKMTNHSTNSYASERADLIFCVFWLNPNDPENFEELDHKKMSHTSLPFDVNQLTTHPISL